MTSSPKYRHNMTPFRCKLEQILGEQGTMSLLSLFGLVHLDIRPEIAVRIYLNNHAKNRDRSGRERTLQEQIMFGRREHLLVVLKQMGAQVSGLSRVNLDGSVTWTPETPTYGQKLWIQKKVDPEYAERRARYARNRRAKLSLGKREAACD